MPRPEILTPETPEHALRIRHKITSGWEQWYLLTSDVHMDSPECYVGLYHKHMREAKERGAMIIDNGDLFDVISGRSDPRGSKGTVREEHSGVNYLDRVVDWGTEELRPYAEQLAYIGTGNHEQGVLVKLETDITARVVRNLNALRPQKEPIHRAGYTGWIRFMFANPNGSNRFSWAMKLEHGTGGNSPVTKGVIQTARRSARVEGATFFVSGHIHERWQMETVVETLNASTSRVEQRPYEHIQLGSYKRDFRTDGVGTWHMMKSGATKPIGGTWLRFYSPNGNDVQYEVQRTWVDYPRLTDYLRKARVVVDKEAAA